jgi:light-harvesting complex I chlorophyll a/b binding protein 1
MRLISFLALLGTTAAFVPTAPLANVGTSSSINRKSVISMGAEDLVGLDTETRGLFDPLGFSKNEENLYRYRAVELKHGRVAMLAVLGTLVQTFVHLPDPVFDNPRPLAALSQILDQRPLAAIQIFLVIGALELTVFRQDSNDAPGQLNNFGANFIPDDEEEFTKLQLKELKNGRLAMMAIIGQFVQEKLTGQGPIEQLLAGHASPFGDGQGFF